MKQSDQKKSSLESLYSKDELEKLRGHLGTQAEKKQPSGIMQLTQGQPAKNGKPGGLPDVNELIDTRRRTTPQDYKEEFPGITGQLGRGLRIGMDGVKQGYHGTRALLEDDPEERQKHMDRLRAINEKQQQEGYMPSNMSFTEIGSAGDAGEWALGQLGALTPIVGSIMVGGLAGGKTGMLVGAAAGPKGMAAGKIGGSVIGSFLQGYNLYAGGMYADLREMDVAHDRAKSTALKYGIPASAVSIAVPSAVTISLLQVFPKQYVRNKAKSMAVGAGLGTVTEGMAEGLAETFVIMGEEFATGVEMPQEERNKRIMDAAAAGALMGKAMGMAGGGALRHVSIDQHMDSLIDTQSEASQQVRRPVIHEYLTRKLGERKKSKGLLPDEQKYLDYLEGNQQELSQKDNRPIGQMVEQNDKILVKVFERSDKDNQARLRELSKAEQEQPGSLSVAEQVELTGIMVNKPKVVQAVFGQDELAEARGEVKKDEARPAKAETTEGEQQPAQTAEGAQVTFFDPGDGLPKQGRIISRGEGIANVQLEDGTSVEIDESSILRTEQAPTGERQVDAEGQPPTGETQRVSYYDGKKEQPLDLQPAQEGVWEADLSRMSEKQAKSIRTQLGRKHPGMAFEIQQSIDEDTAFAQAQRKLVAVHKKSEAGRRFETQQQETVRAEALQAYEARSRGGAKVDVVNKKSGRSIGPRSKYYRPVVKRYFDENYEDIASIQRMSSQDHVDMGNYRSEVAERGENPFEIAEVYLDHRADNPEYFDPVNTTIADMLSRIPKENYELFGDPNQLQWNREIPMNYFTKDKFDAVPIDTQAAEMSEMAGVEITPGDIVEFINEYPGGQKSYYTQTDADPIAGKLKEAFQEATGVTLTDPVAQDLIDVRDGKEVPATETPATEIASEQEIDRMVDEASDQAWQEFHDQQLATLEGELETEKTKRAEDEEISRIARREQQAEAETSRTPEEPAQEGDEPARADQAEAEPETAEVTGRQAEALKRAEFDEKRFIEKWPESEPGVPQSTGKSRRDFKVGDWVVIVAGTQKGKTGFIDSPEKYQVSQSRSDVWVVDDSGESHSVRSSSVIGIPEAEAMMPETAEVAPDEAAPSPEGWRSDKGKAQKYASQLGVQDYIQTDPDALSRALPLDELVGKIDEHLAGEKPETKTEPKVEPSKPEPKTEAKPKPEPKTETKWAEPNEHGVYPGHEAEDISLSDKEYDLSIKVLQIGDNQWISSREYQRKRGDMQGVSTPLSGLMLSETREQAGREQFNLLPDPVKKRFRAEFEEQLQKTSDLFGEQADTEAETTPATPRRKVEPDRTQQISAESPTVSLGEGETALTSSGRETTPFPVVDTSTDRKAQNTIKRVDQWLIDNAVAEAESRGDEHNARSFRAEKPGMPVASRHGMNQYLFGEQPDVVPSILKPLTQTEQESGYSEQTGYDIEADTKLINLNDLGEDVWFSGKALPDGRLILDYTFTDQGKKRQDMMYVAPDTFERNYRVVENENQAQRIKKAARDSKTLQIGGEDRSAKESRLSKESGVELKKPADLKAKPEAEPAKTKQPWEMTVDEYVNFRTEGKEGDKDAIAVAKAAHPKHVKQAVDLGRNVPLEVLQNYRNNQWAKDAIAKQQGEAQEAVSSVASYYETEGARDLAHKVKSGDANAIKQMAREMASAFIHPEALTLRLIPPDAVLVPIPSSTGKATITKQLADEIAKITGNDVADVLTGKKREPLYELKKRGATLTQEELGLSLTGKLPEGKQPLLIDTVYGTGTTMDAARAVIPNATAVVHSIDKSGRAGTQTGTQQDSQESVSYDQAQFTVVEGHLTDTNKKHIRAILEQEINHKHDGQRTRQSLDRGELLVRIANRITYEIKKQGDAYSVITSQRERKHIGGDVETVRHRADFKLSFPRRMGSVEAELTSPVNDPDFKPKIGWRENLMKARAYTYALGINNRTPDGQARTTSQLVDLIDKKTKRLDQAETKTAPDASQIAESAGIQVRSLREMYNLNRDMFAMNRVQALASAVTTDRMIGTMAKRQGTGKADMYSKLVFKKTSQAPEGALLQEPQIFKSIAQEGLAAITQKSATPEQWVKMIADKGGKGTTRELEWIGLRDYLDNWIEAEATRRQKAEADEILKKKIEAREKADGEFPYDLLFEEQEMPARPNIKSVPRDVVGRFIADNQVEIVPIEKVEGARIIEKYDKQAQKHGFSIDIEMGGDAVAVHIEGGERFDTADFLHHTEDTYSSLLADGFKITRDDVFAMRKIMRDLEKEFQDKQVQYPQDRIQLPGGENYREVLLTLPARRSADQKKTPAQLAKELYGKDSFYDLERSQQQEIMRRNVVDPKSIYRTSHWYGQENVLTHIRMNDRTLADGQKVLFVEEIQSDWVAEGRRRGWGKGKGETLTWEQPETVSEGRRAYKTSDGVYFVYENFDAATGAVESVSLINEDNEEVYAGHYNTVDEAKQVAQRFHDGLPADSDTFPQMPYKQTDQWTGLAMRRLLKMAANEGYDRIAWTTGEQQVERNQIADDVEQIRKEENLSTGEPEYNIRLPHGRSLSISVDEGGVIKDLASRDDRLAGQRNEFIGRPFSDVVGKELADRLMEAPVGASFEGEGLRIGGEKMAELYNQIIPSVARKEARRFDKKARIEVIKIEVDKDISEMPHLVPEKVHDAVGDYQHNRISREQLESIAQEHGFSIVFSDPSADVRAIQKAFSQQLSIPITETMRLNLNGAVPLFQGSQGAMLAEDGQYTIYALTNPNVSTPLHELAHVYEHYLSDAEKADVLKWARHESWTDNTSEQFARGFEKYLAEGKAPNSSLQKIFDRFHQWLTDIYNGITGSEIDLTLNEAMRELYGRMLGYEPAQPAGQTTAGTGDSKGFVDSSLRSNNPREHNISGHPVSLIGEKTHSEKNISIGLYTSNTTGFTGIRILDLSKKETQKGRVVLEQGFENHNEGVDFYQSKIDEYASEARPKKERPGAVPSKNKIFTEDAAEAARKRLREKLGRAQVGLDPQTLLDGITLAGFHIEKGARTFSAYSRAMIADLGDGVKPYLKQWYNAVFDSPELQSTDIQAEMTSPEQVRATDLDAVLAETAETTKPAGPDTQGFTSEVKEAIRSRYLGDTTQLNMRKVKAMAENYGLTDAIEIREHVESALYDLAGEVAVDRGAKQGASTKKVYDELVSLYESQPSLTDRSSESVAMQQYSTPIPVSYIAQKFTQADQGVRTFEPSAGTGLMLFASQEANTIVNELDGYRHGVLSGRDYYASWNRDAAKPFTQLAGTQQAVITNPPFGSVEKTLIDGFYNITKLEHLMAIRALDTMADDGKAAMVIGGNNEYADSGMLKGADRVFFNYLYNRYNVTDVIDVSGEMYRRQGAGFPIRLILVDGRKAEPQGVAPAKEGFGEQVKTYEELYERTKTNIASSERQDTTPLLQSQIDADISGRRGDGGVGAQGTQRRAGDFGDLFGPPEAATHREPGRTDEQKQPTTEGTGEQGTTGRGQPDGDQSGMGLAGESGREGSGTDDTSVTGGLQGTRDMAGEAGRGEGERTGRPELRGKQRADRDGGEAHRGTDIHVGRERGRVDARKVIAEEGKNIAYKPRSENYGLETQVPAGMAQQIERSLDRIESQHGPVDDYVMGKLQYDSKKELFDALAGEQIDAVAMAIYQHDNGQAMIIGDMTGVGKGRIAAALLEYGILQGKKPVFVTAKADLFSDMYRDLKGINRHHRKPFIVNTIAGEGKEHIYDQDGNIVRRAMTAKKQAPIINSGDLSGYDMVFATYSQFQKGPDKPKARFIKDHAEGNMLILDESHIASGEDSNTGEFFRGLVTDASGVTFLSATFAKRHDNMGIYALKTGVSESNLSAEMIDEAVGKGGATILELLSSNLSESGQMARREKSYDGITIDYAEVQHISGEEQAQTFDSATELLRDIIEFQKTVVREAIGAIQKAVKAEAKEIFGTKGTKLAGVDNPPFVSRVHNVVEQLLFSVKAEGVTDEAIKLLKENKRPVIAFRNTMESFFKDLGIKPGDEFADLDFSRAMERSLSTVMRVTEKDGGGNENTYSLDPSDLGPDGEAAYNELLQKIRDTTLGIPLSPIDVVVAKLEKAGYTVAEVTGRDMRLELNEDYTSGFARRRVEKNSTKLFKQFNDGQADVLLINQSGSTGVSAHSSTDFKDQRTRAMIIHQPELDINIEVQKRGRINRTGQVALPEYLYAVSSIPAEKRLLMMLKGKLKSLDANTTTSQKSSAKLLQSNDILNKYGDRIVTQYLASPENRYLNYEMLDDPLKLASQSEATIETGIGGAAQKVSGRVALLPVEMQEKFYRDILEQYDSLIRYLDQIGENDLVSQALELNAETKDRKTLVEGNPDGKTAFADPSYLEKMEVDILRKPYKKGELDLQIKEMTEGRDPAEYQKDLLSHYDETMQSRKQKDLAEVEKRYARQREKLTGKSVSIEAMRNQQAKLDAQKAESIESVEQRYQNNRLAVRRLMKSDKLVPGRGVMIPQRAGSAQAHTPGVFLGVNVNKKAKNPYAPSNVDFVFAVADSRRRLPIPASQGSVISGIVGTSDSYSQLDRQDIVKNWDRQISAYDKGRQTRYMVTGDVLKGLAYMDVGRLVKYTTSQGELRHGILLPENYDVAKELGDGKIVSVNHRDVLEKAKELYFPGDKLILDKDVRLEGADRDNLEFKVPKSKRRGGRYFLDDGIRRLVEGANFHTRGNSMVAEISKTKVGDLLNLLHEKFGLKVTVESDEAFDTTDTTKKPEQADPGPVDPKPVSGQTGEQAAEGREPVDVTPAEEAADIGPQDLSLVAFDHTRTGETIHAVQLEKRLGREEFNGLHDIAKQHGGYYSAYRRGGAVPGFHFKDEKSARDFIIDARRTDYIREQEIEYITDSDYIAFKDGEIRAAYGSQQEYQRAIHSIKEQLNLFAKRREESPSPEVWGRERADRAPGWVDNLDRSSFRVPGIKAPVLRRTVAQDFAEHGFVDFVGRRVTSPTDIAELFAVHRSPLIEKLHVALLDEGGRILGFTTITSNMPNAVHLGREFKKQIAGKVREHHASQVVLVHNHPSGNPAPSAADIGITYSIDNALRQEYGGEQNEQKVRVSHVVLNGDKATYISTDKKFSWVDRQKMASQPYFITRNMDKITSRFTYDSGRKRWESPIGVTTAPPVTSEAFTRFARSFPLEQNTFGVALLTGKNTLRAWEVFDVGSDVADVAHRLAEMAKRQGAMRAIFVSSDKHNISKYHNRPIEGLEVLDSFMVHDNGAVMSLRSFDSLRTAEGETATFVHRGAQEPVGVTEKQVLWSVWEDAANYQAQTGVKIGEELRWNAEDMARPTPQTVVSSNMIKNTVSQWNNAGDIVIAENITELPRDIRYRVAAMDRVPGSLQYEGKIYLPVFAHSNEGSAWSSLVNEIVAQKGLSGLTGMLPGNLLGKHMRNLNEMLNRVFADYAGTPEMSYVGERMGIDFSSEAGKRGGAEALLSYKASQGGGLMPMEQRLYDHIRDVVEGLGSDGPMPFAKMMDVLADFWLANTMAKGKNIPAELLSAGRVHWDSHSEQLSGARRSERGESGPRVRRPVKLDEYQTKTQAIEAEINKMTENWADPSRVVFVKNVHQLPAMLQAEAQKHGRVGGYWLDGVSYLLSWNLDSAEQAQRVLLHEAIGHEGVRKWVKQTVGLERYMGQLNAIYDDIYRSYRSEPDFRRLADKYGLDLRKTEDQRIAADEYVAHLAESGVEASLVDRIVNYLRNMIRRAGFDLAITDGELRTLIANAHRAVEGTDRHNVAGYDASRARPETGIRASLLDFEADPPSRAEYSDDTTVPSGYARIGRLKGLFMEPLHYLEQTRGLKYMAEAVRGHYDRWAQHRGHLRGMIYRQVHKPMKRLSRADRRLVKKQYGEYQRLKETGQTDLAQAYLPRTHGLVQTMVDLTRQIGDYAGALNEALGVQVFDPSIGKWRKIGRARDFFPRKLNKLTEMTLRNPSKHLEHWNALVDTLIAEGHVENAAEADKYLKTYISDTTQTDYFAGVEKARSRALPPMAYDYSFDVMIDYAERWSERIAQIEHFGQQTEPGTMDLFNEAITNRISDEQTRTFVGALRDRVYNKNYQDGFHQALAGLNKITTGMQLGNWGTATLNLFGGLTLNFIAYPNKATAQAMGELTGINRFARDMMDGSKSKKEAFKDLVELRGLGDVIQEGITRGALTNDMISLLRDTDNITGTFTLPEWTGRLGLTDRTLDLNHALNRFVNFTMKYGGYTPTEIFIRSHAQLSGKYFLRDSLEHWNSDIASRKSLQRIRWMQENGFDYRRLLRENGQGAYTERFIRYTSNLTQGSYKVDQVPIHIDTPVGRFVFKYVKFITQATRLFYKNHLTPFADTIKKGGTDVTVEIDGVKTTKRVAEFHSMLRFFAAATIGGEFVRGLRNFLFGYMFQGPELDELEKALEDDERMLLLTLMFDRAYWNLQAVGGLTIFGNYGQMMSDVYTRERMRNPLDPPALGMLKGVGELGLRAMEQGKLTGRDIDDVIQSTFSLYRTTKRPALSVLDEVSDQTGIELNEARYYVAGLDRSWARKMYRRFSDEAGLEARRTATGRFPRTENSPINQAIYEALLVGDGARAGAEFVRGAENRSGEDISRLQASVRASMRARQPFGNISQEQKQNFLEWAKQRLSGENYQRLLRMDKQYWQAYEKLNEVMGNVARGLKDIDARIDRLKQASDSPQHRRRIQELERRRYQLLKELK